MIFWKRKGILVVLAFILTLIISFTLDNKFPQFMDAWMAAFMALLFSLINLLFTKLFTSREVQISQEAICEIMEKNIAQHRLTHPNYNPSKGMRQFGKFALYLQYSRCSSLFFIRNKYYTYIGLVVCLFSIIGHLTS